VFLIRAKDNIDGKRIGVFSFEGPVKDMRYELDQDEVSMAIQEVYSTRESINWFYTFLGSGVTLSGLLGFLSSRLFPRKSNEEKGTA
jgi:hypothetical protein